MTVYYGLYFFMTLLSFFLKKIKKKEYSNIASWVFIILIFLVLALRHPSMGHDLRYGTGYGYLGWYQKIANGRLTDVFEFTKQSNYDIGFVLFNKIISLISKNIQYFIIICTAISILPYAVFIKDNSELPLLSTVLFIANPSFLMQYSSIMQNIAMGICCISYKYIYAKDFKKFILTILLASLFHFSAIFFLVVYFAYHYELSKNKRLISVIILPIVFSLRIYIFPLVVSYFGSHILAGETSSTKSFWIYYAIYIFAVFAYEINKGNKESKDETNKINAFLNIYFLAVLFMIFQDINSLSARLAAYYIISLIVLIPCILSKINNKHIFAFCYIFFLLGFTYYGLNKLDVGRDSYAQCSPYYFFWQSR